jgi:ABC-type multidrug transport system ATPase subunit
MRAIEQLTRGRTVIIISHRLSTLGHVDEIAVLEEGRIVEHGTYRQLKARGGTFARLLDEQNRYAAQQVRLIRLALTDADSPDTDGSVPAPVGTTGPSHETGTTNGSNGRHSLD